MTQEDVYIEARPYTLKDFAKKLNKRDREFLFELLKQYYKDGFKNCFKMLTK